MSSISTSNSNIYKKIKLESVEKNYNRAIFIKDAKKRYLIDTGAPFTFCFYEADEELPGINCTITMVGQTIKNPKLGLYKIELGHRNIPFVCFGDPDLKHDANIDAILGIDFLKGKKLHLDFDINGGLSEDSYLEILEPYKSLPEDKDLIEEILEDEDNINSW